MFLELADEVFFVSNKFYKKAGKLILGPKTEECSFEKNVEVFFLFTIIYDPLLSSFGDNLLISWF